MKRTCWLLLLGIVFACMPAAAGLGGGKNPPPCEEFEILSLGPISAYDADLSCDCFTTGCPCAGQDLVFYDWPTFDDWWKSHSPLSETPFVDFTQKLVVATFLGEQPILNIGYGITCVQYLPNGLQNNALGARVNVIANFPGQNCILLPLTSNQHMIATIARVPGNVAFAHGQQTITCPPGGDVELPCCEGCQSGSGQPESNPCDDDDTVVLPGGGA